MSGTSTWRDLFFLFARTAIKHGFGEAGAAVVDRRVRHVHAGQRGHHRLEFVDQLQRALARLGLVRRVRGEEFAALRDVPDRGRNVVVVAAGAEETDVDAVALGALATAARACPSRCDRPALWSASRRAVPAGFRRTAHRCSPRRCYASISRTSVGRMRDERHPYYSSQNIFDSRAGMKTGRNCDPACVSRALNARRFRTPRRSRRHRAARRGRRRRSA